MLQSLLTLDAGITTGYSYWIRHELQDSGGVPYDREAQAFVGVPETLWYKNIELVVMELTKPWIGQLSADLQHVQQIWAGMFPDLVTVQPWQWKPSDRKSVV